MMNPKQTLKKLLTIFLFISSCAIANCKSTNIINSLIGNIKENNNTINSQEIIDINGPPIPRRTDGTYIYIYIYIHIYMYTHICRCVISV